MTHYRGRQLANKISNAADFFFFCSVLSHNGTEALAQPTRGDKRRSVLLNLGLSNHHFLIHGQKAAQGVTTHYTHSHGKTKKNLVQHLHLSESSPVKDVYESGSQTHVWPSFRSNDEKKVSVCVDITLFAAPHLCNTHCIFHTGPPRAHITQSIQTKIYTQ